MATDHSLPDVDTAEHRAREPVPARGTRCGHHRAGAQARAVLAEARERNPHIPAYLAGRKRLPRERPAYTVFGEESEAVDYAAGDGELWRSVPGALAWLES